MPKYTQKQLTDLLSTLMGETVELVEADTDSDFNADAVLSAIDKARTPVIKSALHKDIHSELSRKINGSYRNNLSKLTGIPVADLADLESEQMLSKSLDFMKASMSDDGKKWAEERANMLKSHEDEKSKITAELTTKYNELEGRLTRKQMLDILTNNHTEAKGLPEKANRALMAEGFLSYIESLGIPKISEDGKRIALYRKDAPEMQMLNESQNNVVFADDYIKPRYTELGLWNEDTRDVSAASAASKAPSGLAGSGQQQSQSLPMTNTQASQQAFAQVWK